MPAGILFMCTTSNILILNISHNYNKLWITDFQIAPEQESPSSLQQGNAIQDKCIQDATTIVEKSNKSLGRRAISNKRIVELITGLTSVMLQVQV